ncbi:aggregation factor core [Psychromonas sp. psych-6C06]|uniref:aggregation factor core n=1 Tax=Psychromonas sp. psych-6C06 TaxID=2058089 RepID=UPI000C32E45C|nr:aggregation factor core [Psychromonas sp. psych-6C06]PKF62016.1 aggregation factor core [Psychromonas sp. psych-6C06]
MSNILLSVALLVMLCSSQYAYADIEVKFLEGAPKDKFVFKNTSECNLQNIVLKVDLSNSQGGLIFDTTATGQGVEVFQPFEVTEGELALTSSGKVKDGAKHLSLNVKSINAKQSVSFTIDVDDTLDRSELGNIRVSGNEITNAAVDINFDSEESATAVFNKQGKALLLMPQCTV